jgi:hypothetical protein
VADFPDLVNELQNFSILAISLFRPPLFGRIAKHQDDAGNASILVPNGRRAVGNGPLGPVPGDEHGMVAQANDLTFAQGPGDGILDGLATLLLEDAEHRRQRFPMGPVLLRPAGH